jgi:hypothetical protein
MEISAKILTAIAPSDLVRSGLNIFTGLIAADSFSRPVLLKLCSRREKIATAFTPITAQKIRDPASKID